MKCIFCDSLDTGVVDSRMTEDGRAIRRRRSCPFCTRRFTTYERAEEAPLLVIKRGGQRQLFDQNKLITGMMKACEKRPIDVQKLEEIAHNIERFCQESGDKEFTSFALGEHVMKALRNLDEVAYVRFASVYRSFCDANEFAVELERIKSDTL